MANRFKADHVGSLLRPPELLLERAAFAKGGIELEQLRQEENRAILTALELQTDVGLDIFTDGEFRRGDFRTNLIESVEGFTPLTRSPMVWHSHESEAVEPATSWTVTSNLRQRCRLTDHESKFMKEHSPGPFKITLPSVSLMGSRCYQPAGTRQSYPKLSDLLGDLVTIYQSEIRALVEEGVPYIQIDAPNYPSYVDERHRYELQKAGVDIDREIDELVAADNACIQGVNRKEVTLALHLCRGNNRSAWTWEGSYDWIAEKVFGLSQFDRLLLEYDNERSGGFEPLRFVPTGKTVVLGLITTKEGRLESEDHLLRRIEEASRFIPIENLAISPQCGFASVAAGNLVTWDDQRRKLELVVKTANKVWA